MCARHGREAIEICLSEKGTLTKKDWETLVYSKPRLIRIFSKTGCKWWWYE